MKDKKTAERFRATTAALTTAACLLAAQAQGADQAAGGAPQPSHNSGTVREMSLEDCLSSAMQHNHRRSASQFAVAMAEAQHRQALAGYWPQINGKVGYQRMDESPDFLFPASSMSVPAQAINVPAGTALVTVPAGVLGPSAVQLPVSTPAQTF